MHRTTEGKTLSLKGSSGLWRRLEPSAPGSSWAPPTPFWLHWPQRQLLPVSDLLASPIPLPPTGERGLDTSARTPAWPRTGLHSPTPWHPPCGSGSRKRLPSTAPYTGLCHLLRQFRLMSPFSRISPCSSCGCLGSSATSCTLLRVSWSSLVTNMIPSFASCRQ